MSDLSVVRWRKYGKDRLYVTAADAVKLGYRDLITGEDHVAEPVRAAEFAEAVAAWLGRRPVDDGQPALVAPPETGAADVEVPVATPRAESGPQATPPEWDDLATHRAGAMAREQALALKQSAPVRTFVARVLGVHTDERAWRIGADGEEKVAGQLEKLLRKDPRWRFLHAVPVGSRGSDIDHVVIGPPGVFTLNAKHHPGAKVWVRGDTLMINGQRQPYIRNSLHEAARAGRLLSTVCGFPVVVTGVVVPVGADDVTIKALPTDVHVINRMRLARWLGERPPVLSEETVDLIFDMARRSTTWVNSTAAGDRA